MMARIKTHFNVWFKDTKREDERSVTDVHRKGLTYLQFACFCSFIHPDVINGKVGAVQEKDEGQTDANKLVVTWSASFVTGCVGVCHWGVSDAPLPLHWRSLLYHCL